MKDKEQFLDYLEDIIDAMEKGEKFTHNMKFNDFKNDDKTVFAVIRALEIIGEATKKIPKFFRKKYPKIPWKKMAGMRDKMIHDYFGVDLKVIWKTIKNEVPTVKPYLKEVVEDIKKK